MTGLSIVGSSSSGFTQSSAAKSGGRSSASVAAAGSSGKKAKPVAAARPPPPKKATAATTHPLTPGFYLIDSGTSYLYLLGDEFALFDAAFCTAVMQGRPWSCGGANGGGGDASTSGYQVCDCVNSVNCKGFLRVDVPQSGPQHSTNDTGARHQMSVQRSSLAFIHYVFMFYIRC